MCRAPDDDRRASDNQLAITLGTFGCTLTAYLAYGFPYPPLQDYVEWMIQGRMISDILYGAGSTCAEIRRYPIPNSFTQLALGIANSITSTVQAGIIVLSAYVILACIAIWKFTTRYSPHERLTCVVLAVTVFFGFPFWSGLLNFQFGLVAIAFYLCLSPAKQSNPVCLLIFSVFIYFSHAIPWTAFLLIASARIAEGSFKRRIWLGLALLPSLLMAFAYVYVRDENSLDESQAAYYSAGKHLLYKIYTFTKIGPYHNWIINGKGDHERFRALIFLGILINSAYALLVGMLMRNALRNSSSLHARHTVYVSLLLIAAFMAAPHYALGIINPGERFLYVFILVALTLQPKSPTSSSALSSLIALLSVCVVANLWFLTKDDSLEDAFGYWPASPPKAGNLYWVAPLQFNRKLQYSQKLEGTNLPRISIDFRSGPLRAKAGCDQSVTGPIEDLMPSDR